MIKKEYYKACDLFITSTLQRRRYEFFNEYGYNLNSNRKNQTNHFKEFSTTQNNNCQNKAKKIVK